MVAVYSADIHVLTSFLVYFVLLIVVYCLAKTWTQSVIVLFCFDVELLLFLGEYYCTNILTCVSGDC